VKEKKKRQKKHTPQATLVDPGWCHERGMIHVNRSMEKFPEGYCRRKGTRSDNATAKGGRGAPKHFHITPKGFKYKSKSGKWVYVSAAKFEKIYRRHIDTFETDKEI